MFNSKAKKLVTFWLGTSKSLVRLKQFAKLYERDLVKLVSMFSQCLTKLQKREKDSDKVYGKHCEPRVPADGAD